MTTLRLLQLLVEADPTGEREVKFYDHSTGESLNLAMLSFCSELLVAHFFQRDEIEEAAAQPLRKDPNDLN